jgi:hypothetical protein
MSDSKLKEEEQAKERRPLLSKTSDLSKKRKLTDK